MGVLVGKGVKVAVGGNQMIVGVAEVVAVELEVGGTISEGVAGNPLHPKQRIPAH